MEVHDVCSIFPLMSDEEFAGLKADITAHGLREPVWTYQGKLIDGRNRLRVCRDLGIEPAAREWDGNGSLVQFVASLNLHRRHLSSGQKAACGVEVEAQLAKEAKQRQRAAGSEGGKRSAAARRVPPEAENPTPSGAAADPAAAAEPANGEEFVPQPSTPAQRRPQVRDQAAALVGTNPRYLQDAKAIARRAPDLHAKVKHGQMTLPQAKREVRRAEARAALQAKAEAAAAATDPTATTWDLIEGDCSEVLAGLQPGSARLIFADPPDNTAVHYGDHSNDNQDPDEFLTWCGSWMRACARVLADDGSLWVLISDEWADRFGCLLREVGLHRRSWIIWYEGVGGNRGNHFNRCKRHLFHMVKDPRRCVFHPDAVTRPRDRRAKDGDPRADPAGTTWEDVWPIPRLTGTCAERLPDVPTQLPLDLLTPIVGCASEPGDLVLDPFSGSGTTGVAALHLGRRYLGVEQSGAFAHLARQRLAAESSPEAPAAG